MPRFAHLLGLSRPAAGKSKADKPDDQRDDESDDEYQERKKREEEDSASAASGNRAEKPADQGDDESDEDYKKRKDREEQSARADDDDEDGDESMSEEDDTSDKEDKKDAKATAARRRERARCSAIFASKHAATRPDMAAHYAFATNLTRREARSALAAVAAGQPKALGGLAMRMTGMETIRPGAGAPAGKPNTASSWDAAAKQAGLLPK